MDQTEYEKIKKADQDLQLSLHPDMIFFVKNALEEKDDSHIVSLADTMHTADLIELINHLDSLSHSFFQFLINVFGHTTKFIL